MTELEIRILAAKVLESPKNAHGSAEKRLAAAVLSYFDPNFFLKSVDKRLDSLSPFMELKSAVEMRKKPPKKEKR